MKAAQVSVGKSIPELKSNLTIFALGIFYNIYL